VREGSLVKIVPLAEGWRNASVSMGAGNRASGLDRAAALCLPSTVAKTAEGFLSRPAHALIPSRNLVADPGPTAERQSALDLIATSTWNGCATSRVAVYPLKVDLSGDDDR